MKDNTQEIILSCVALKHAHASEQTMPRVVGHVQSGLPYVL